MRLTYSYVILCIFACEKNILIRVNGSGNRIFCQPHVLHKNIHANNIKTV